MPAAVDRKTLRRMVGRLTGELVICTATAAGTASTFIDQLKLAYENNTLNGREAVCSGGTPANLGVVARVTGNSKSACSVTLNPALPEATQAGDVLELWNEQDTQSCVDEVHDQLNFYIAAVAGTESVEVLDTEQAFSATAPTLALPATWEAFSGVDWKDVFGVWHQVRAADCEIDRAARTVTLRNTSAQLADTLSVRLRGLDAAAPLADDADTTTVNEEWLVHQVAGMLLLSHAARQLNPQAQQTMANVLLTTANALRPLARARTSRRAIPL